MARYGLGLGKAWKDGTLWTKAGSVAAGRHGYADINLSRL